MVCPCPALYRIQLNLPVLKGPIGKHIWDLSLSQWLAVPWGRVRFFAVIQAVVPLIINLVPFGWDASLLGYRNVRQASPSCTISPHFRP